MHCHTIIVDNQYVVRVFGVSEQEAQVVAFVMRSSEYSEDIEPEDVLQLAAKHAKKADGLNHIPKDGARTLLDRLQNTNDRTLRGGCGETDNTYRTVKDWG